MEVSKQVLANSEIKWHSGLKLAEIQDFGGATSMAIISVEELVKSLVIYLDGIGFEIRNVKGINRIFRNHQVRYIIAYAMFVMSVFGDEIIKWLLEYRDKPEEIEKFHSAIVNNEKKLKSKVMFYFFRKLILLKKEFKWFSQVDVFRQDGFYCDYHEQLKTPISITKKDYDKLIVRLEKVKTIGTGLMESFSDEHNTETLQYIKKQLRKNNGYKGMETALASLSNTTESPFALVSKYFK